MAEDVLLVMARRGGRYVAGASISNRRRLSLWPALGAASRIYPFLHFEVCYHLCDPISPSPRGLPASRPRPGRAQAGARANLPATTHSAHYIDHPGLRRAGCGLSRPRNAATWNRSARCCGTTGKYNVPAKVAMTRKRLAADRTRGLPRLTLGPGQLQTHHPTFNRRPADDRAL